MPLIHRPPPLLPFPPTPPHILPHQPAPLLPSQPVPPLHFPPVLPSTPTTSPYGTMGRPCFPFCYGFENFEYVGSFVQNDAGQDKELNSRTGLAT